MDLHPHTHFDPPLRQADVQVLRQGADPVGTDASGRQNDGRCGICSPGRAQACDPAARNQHLLDRFPGLNRDAFSGDVIRHLADMVWQVIGAEMFLLDDQQIDTVFFGLLA